MLEEFHLNVMTDLIRNKIWRIFNAFFTDIHSKIFGYAPAFRLLLWIFLRDLMYSKLAWRLSIALGLGHWALADITYHIIDDNYIWFYISHLTNNKNKKSRGLVLILLLLVVVLTKINPSLKFYSIKQSIKHSTRKKFFIIIFLLYIVLNY